jgi:TorA maturation chaperone TorD
MSIHELLEARLLFYRLLSGLYRYPLSGEKLTALANVSMQSNSPLAQTLQGLQETLSGSDDAFIERLNVEMTRLLEGPGITPAVPFASYYLNGKQLMGPAAQAVRRKYLEWGVEPKEGSIPPDHIALELGFLSFLAEQSLSEERREEALRSSFAFLSENLKPWLGLFCTASENAAQEPFFSMLAVLTRQFVAEDEAWLQEWLLEPVS